MSAPPTRAERTADCQREVNEAATALLARVQTTEVAQKELDAVVAPYERKLAEAKAQEKHARQKWIESVQRFEAQSK